jgi:hypothetical protein
MAGSNSWVYLSLLNFFFLSCFIYLFSLSWLEYFALVRKLLVKELKFSSLTIRFFGFKAETVERACQWGPTGGGLRKRCSGGKNQAPQKNVQALVVSLKAHQVAPSSIDVSVLCTRAFESAVIILLALLFLPAPYAKVSSPWHGMPWILEGCRWIKG